MNIFFVKKWIPILFLCLSFVFRASGQDKRVDIRVKIVGPYSQVFYQVDSNHLRKAEPVNGQHLITTKIALQKDKLHYLQLYFINNEQLPQILLKKDLGSLTKRAYVLLLDSSKIDVSVIGDEPVISVLGGYENHVKSQFDKSDRRFVSKLLVDSSGDENRLYAEKYYDVLNIIKNNPRSIYASKKTAVFFSPKALVAKDSIIHFFENNKYKLIGNVKISDLILKYKEFIRVNEPKQMFFPDLELIVKGSATLEYRKIKSSHEYILVDIWATWCGPCIKGHSLLNDLSKKYQNSKKFAFVGVATLCLEKGWKTHLTKNPFNYANYWIDYNKYNHLFSRMTARGLPYYAIVRTSDSKIIYEFIQLEDIEKRISEFL